MKNMMVMTLVLLSSCSLFGKKEKLKDWGEPTSAGYRVEWADKGTTSSDRHTKAEILALFDKAMVQGREYLITRYGATLEQVNLYAHATRYHLIDDKRIATNASGTGFASGITYETNIYICLMTRSVVGDRESVPADAAPWTIVDLGDGKWSYGRLDPVRPFPALGHELGHRLYGPGFEH